MMAAEASSASPVLHLASASARRREILAVLGVPHSWAGVDFDETPGAGEAAEDLVRRLASGKAALARQQGRTAAFIIGADTLVVVDGEVFGKPGSRQAALDMLTRLSGRSHTVLTAVAVNTPGREWLAVSRTTVSFREVSRAEARAYWDSGEAAGKAGAYAIQGLGGVFVESLSGSYSGVVGLPVFETATLLRRAGLDILQSPLGRPKHG